MAFKDSTDEKFQEQISGNKQETIKKTIKGFSFDLN